MAITTQGTFWLFMGFSTFGLLYGVFLLPETKGKTLEEISKYFEESTRRVVINGEVT